MSVLIKDMEMPTSCESCPCKTSDAFGGLGCQTTGYIPLRKANQGRPDWCPLVEIPPHGRLIDADKLKEEFPHDEDWDYPVNTNSYVVETIDKSPTIIEAEEGE